MRAVDEVLASLDLALEGARSAAADVRDRVRDRAHAGTAEELRSAADALVAVEALQANMLELREEWQRWSVVAGRGVEPVEVGDEDT